MAQYRTKTGLPLERHQELGPELAAIRDRLLHLSVEIGNSYPKHSRIFRLTERITDVLDSLRSDLEEAMFRENHDHPSLSTQVYYPTGEDRRDRRKPVT